MKLRDVTNMLGIPLPKSSNQTPPTQPATEATQPMQPINETIKREVIYSWEAISRPVYAGLNPKMSRTLIVIGIVVSLFLVAMQQFFLIIGILSLVFVSYMLMQVPGETLKYEISNVDVKYGEHSYKWHELLRFFFLENSDVDVVAIDVKEGLPSRLYLTLLPGDREKVQNLLNEHLTYLESEPKTFADRAYESVVGKLNLK